MDWALQNAAKLFAVYGVSALGAAPLILVSRLGDRVNRTVSDLSYSSFAGPAASKMGATYVGTSKRYADSIDRRIGVQADLSIMRGGEPESLTAKELELTTEAVTKTPQPMPVTAWVRYGRIGLRVSGRAVAWTSKAVAVEWDGPDGPHRAWVWASAVDRSVD